MSKTERVAFWPASSGVTVRNEGMLRVISPGIVNMHPRDNSTIHTPGPLNLSSKFRDILSTSPGLGIGEIDELE